MPDVSGFSRNLYYILSIIYYPIALSKRGNRVEHYEEITVCGKPALFTNFRIKRDTVPDGLYAYDVRHDDDCRGIPCEIAPFIMINHWGTIILAEPLELPNDGRRYIDEETDWNYDPFGGAEKNQKPCVTVEEFMNQYLNR